MARPGRLVAWIAGAMMATAAMPASAEVIGSGGEAFLKALRENDNNSAIPILEAMGRQALDYRGYKGETPLHIIIGQRDTTWLGYLVGEGANPNIKDGAGEPALVAAARIGFDEGVRRLLESGARVDDTNRLGETALIVAVNQRRPMTARLLLARGANPDLRDHATGYSARDYAKRDGRSGDLLRLMDEAAKKKAEKVGPTR